MINDPRYRHVGANEIVDLLNEAARLDPEAMIELIQARVECNAALGEHPTIQTGRQEYGARGYEVGILGILNGILGTFANGWGCIQAVVQDEPISIHFEVANNSEKT